MVHPTEFLIEKHPLLPLLSTLIVISLSEKLDSIKIRLLSNELIKFASGRLEIKDDDDLRSNDKFILIDLAINTIIKRFLHHLAQIIQTLLNSEEVYKVLQTANEPFKKTRRRLPPRAQSQLNHWLAVNTAHPYMTEGEIEEFCGEYEGIEADQVRIFMTNARRKMSDGVRKRAKKQQ